jgi:hypothetical protein
VTVIAWVAIRLIEWFGALHGCAKHRLNEWLDAQ